MALVLVAAAFATAVLGTGFTLVVFQLTIPKILLNEPIPIVVCKNILY